MKLKGPGKQTFNILFHTHTVAGIVISFALFVIFYAGAWSLFRDDFSKWQNPYLQEAFNTDFSYEKAIDTAQQTYNFDLHRGISIALPSRTMPYFRVSGRAFNPDSSTYRVRAYINTHDYSIHENINRQATASSTVYHLHYFDQIPEIGETLASLVALFFLFAIVTGLIIHWKNLFTKFYAFVTEGKWKTIWTNAHTVLGVIGLPFQLLYAITGAFFGVLTFAMAPSLFFVHNGDSRALSNERFPERQIQLDPRAPSAANITFSQALATLNERYPGLDMKFASLKNYGKADAIITFRAQEDENMASRGRITMRMTDGAILYDYSIDPDNKPYTSTVSDLIRRWHFGEFGGLLLRITFFVLAMLTCLMLIAGILIWRQARDNKRYSYQQRLFHHRVTKVYLAICLSLWPAIGLIYLAEKVVPMDYAGRVALINQVFFGGWLLLTVMGCFWNSYARQYKRYLVLGGLLAISLPIANGLTTGLWPWKAWPNFVDIMSIDIALLIAGVTSLYVAFKAMKGNYNSNEPVKEVALEEAKPRAVEAKLPTLKPEVAFDALAQKPSN